jgi:membrane protease YdiL (CAAX protease family)
VACEDLYNLRGNVPVFLTLLAFTWPLAAIIEEMVFRGYLLNRLADLFGRGKAGWGVSLILSALMFSLAHDLNSLVPLFAICLQGLLMGCLYLVNRCNLWLPIVAHGTGITINVTLAFLGIV